MGRRATMCDVLSKRRLATMGAVITIAGLLVTLRLWGRDGLETASWIFGIGAAFAAVIPMLPGAPKTTADDASPRVSGPRVPQRRSSGTIAVVALGALGIGAIVLTVLGALLILTR